MLIVLLLVVIEYPTRVHKNFKLQYESYKKIFDDDIPFDADDPAFIYAKEYIGCECELSSKNEWIKSTYFTIGSAEFQ